MSGEFITFDEAQAMLCKELNYPAEKAKRFVLTFDTNHDGHLSRAEFDNFKSKLEDTKHQLVPKFKEYDRDGNGFITLDEACEILRNPPFNFPSGKVLWLLKKFDNDGNGKLDIEEFADFYAEAKATNERIASAFDRLDKDGNGVLSPAEVSVVIKEQLGYDDSMAQWLVQMFDQNKDGSLDKTEFMDMWTSMFG